MKKVQLYFDPGPHTYTDDEGNAYTSATTLIGMVEEPYPHKYWAMYRALDETGYKLRPDKVSDIDGRISVYREHDLFDKWKVFTTDELYNGILTLKRPVESIVNEWKDMATVACDWGNEKHNYLEDCIDAFYGETGDTKDKGTVADMATTLNMEYDPRTSSFRLKIVNETQLVNSPLSKSHQSIYKLLLGLVNSGFVLYAEKRIYSYDHRISGTIDVLAVRGKDFYIVDWKTNKGELHFESGYYKKAWNADRTLKLPTNEWVKTDSYFQAPISHIQSCKGNTYSLQLSIYAYLCELWGYNCLGLILCHIRNEEKIKNRNIHDGHNVVKVGIDISKKELPPRIYRDIKYLKQEVKTLFEWHRSIKVDKLSVNEATRKIGNFRQPIRVTT